MRMFKLPIATKGAACCLLAVAFSLLLITSAFAGDVGVHSSGRYYQDSTGKPVFLIGYYGWAAVVDGTYINDAGMYSSMMNQGASYKVNYIRISLGVNHFTSSTNPPVYSGGPNPVPFGYNGSGKCVLADTTTIPNTINWDPTFWTGLAAQCALAKQDGVIAHVSIFDGVELRDQGGASYGYNNCYWNPSCQDKAYYPAGSYGDCGGCFYRLTDFNNGTGIGYYQKAIIDKTCATVAPYDNVIIEVGNELLGSDPAWMTAVISYIKTKTNKPVTTVGNIGTGTQGYSDHIDDTVAQLQASLASMVGRGYPAWVDPDGSQIEFLDPDGIRQCYWVAFCSGAAAYGGFCCDFWTWPTNPPPGFNTLKATYCKYLQNFLSDSAVQFGTMTPQHSLVSNAGTNLCLASTGAEYVAYILSDSSATLNLSGISGAANYQLFNPKTGVYTSQTPITGGSTSTFTRPAGWSDWVIHVYTGGSRPAQTEQTLLVKPAGTITIDGNSSDWGISGCESIVHAGVKEHGSVALTGFDNGILYRGAYVVTLPTSATDHTAKVYSRHDANYIYFLVRCDDDDIQYSNPVSANWANDCVEFYIDPANAGGASAISSSTSDIQLVIDANNQQNVYMTTTGYATQVLAGLTSAVTRDATGWWLEGKLAKNALSPALPASGKIGLDFNFRDNDNNNDPTKTTVYTWAETSTAGFPSKIPDHWGKAYLGALGVTPYPGPSAAAVPGRIEAENYDNGGEGAGYHDTTSGNTGGQYRSDGVDIQAASDAGGGYCVGYIDTGEWLNYTASVASAGNYNIKVRVATPNTGCSFHIEMDGQDVTGTQNLVASGGWQNWNTVTISNIYMGACQHWFKFVVDAGGFNFNYMDFQAVTTCQAGDPFDLAPAYQFGTGQTPAIATDSQGYLHIVYTTGGSSIYYKKYSPDNLTTPIVSETIPAPAGYSNFTNPHIAIDSNDVPHVVFCQSFSYSPAVWYTNRMGGTWKATPFSAMTGGTPSGSVTRYPRIVLVGGNAFISSMLWLGNDGGHVWGRIIKLTNLSGTPSVTASAEPQYLRCTIAANGAGNICAQGRNDANGHYFQEYDQNLNPVGAMVEWSVGKGGKTNSPATICSGPDGTVHMFTDAAYTTPDVCQMIYNNTSRRNANGTFQNCLRGLNGGAPGTGPDPTGEITYNSGWWNDEVWPVAAVDKIGRVYVAYTAWTNQPLKGRITTVSPAGFLEPPIDFTTNMYYQPQQYNCEIAPGINGGVYVVWQGVGADGNSPLFVRGVGAGSACNQAPASPTQFGGASGSQQVVLSWTNPGDSDFQGTMIRYRTDTYPSSATDGQLVCNRTAAPSSADIFTHTGLTNGVTYYYSAFAYDKQPLYSDPAVVAVTPITIPDWLNETFDGYTNADLGGQGGWSSIGTSGQVQSGVAKAGKAVFFNGSSAAASGNQISFTDKTTGTMLVDFDVEQDATGTAGQELAYVSVYGSDSPMEIMRIHIQKGRIFAEYGPASPGSLGLVSNAVSNLTWNNVRIGFNIDAKTFDVWLDGVSKSTGNAWKTGASKVSRVVIGCDRNTNLNPQKVYFDNLRVEPKPGQVASVTDDGGWSPSVSKLHFTFPAVAGTPEYQYAIGTTSGGTQTRGWTSCGTSTDVIATGLSLTENTTTYYVSVECLTQFGTAGAARNSNGIKVGVGVGKIKDAKALADGTSTVVKALRGKLVSVPFSGYFYVQEPDGPFGMKVLSSAAVSAGDLIDVCGVMKGAGAERYLDATAGSIIKTTPTPGGPYPLVLGNAAIGGADLCTNAPGIIGGTGPHSIGLYTIAYGKVTQRQTTAPAYFYIDDGKGLTDGTTTGGVANVGIRVSADPTSYPAGSYVSVTGIVSCFDASGLRPQMLPQTIQLLRAP